MTMRRSLSIAAVFIALVFASARAQEIHTLTTPTSVTTTTYTLTYVGLDVASNRIVVNLTSNTGVLLTKTYDSTTTPTGATLLHTLNTANFTVTSLVKNVYTRLVTDGVIPAGSVSGSPQ